MILRSKLKELGTEAVLLAIQMGCSPGGRIFTMESLTNLLRYTTQRKSSEYVCYECS